MSNISAPLRHRYYTSYFGNMKHLPEDSWKVSIARYTPKWLTQEFAPNFDWTDDCFLAPSEDLLRDIKSGAIDERQYTERYVKEILENIPKRTGKPDLGTWLRAWDSSAAPDSRDVIFLCYEKPGDFCHRHILAKLLKYYGIDVLEWKNSGNYEEELF